jgi:hypothetical protein
MPRQARPEATYSFAREGIPGPPPAGQHTRPEHTIGTNHQRGPSCHGSLAVLLAPCRSPHIVRVECAKHGAAVSG